MHRSTLTLVFGLLPACDAPVGSVGETTGVEKDTGAYLLPEPRVYDIGQIPWVVEAPAWMDCFDLVTDGAAMQRADDGDLIVVDGYAVDTSNAAFMVREYAPSGSLKRVVNGIKPTELANTAGGFSADGNTLLFDGTDLRTGDTLISWFDLDDSTWAPVELLTFDEEIVVGTRWDGVGTLWLLTQDWQSTEDWRFYGVRVGDPIEVVEHVARGDAYHHWDQGGNDPRQGLVWVEAGDTPVVLSGDAEDLPLETMVRTARRLPAPDLSRQHLLDDAGFTLLLVPETDEPSEGWSSDVIRHDREGAPKWRTRVLADHLEMSAYGNGGLVATLRPCGFHEIDPPPPECNEAAMITLDDGGEIVRAMRQGPNVDFTSDGGLRLDDVMVFSGRNAAGQTCVAGFPIE